MVKMIKLISLPTFLLLSFLAFATLLNPAYAGTKASIVAVVNDVAISSIDLQNKVKLLIFTTGKKDNPDNFFQYRQEALEMLVDEALKIQAGVSIKPSSLKNAENTARSYFENIYRSENLTATERLQAAGIQISTALDQLKADIIWADVLTTKFKRQFSQIETLAKLEQKRLMSDLSAPQYKISEIVLMPIPSRPLEQTRKLAAQLKESIDQGADFNAIAAQYSMSASSKNGGNIGWVQAKRLPADIQNVIESGLLSKKNIVSVSSNDFFYIFKLEGLRNLGFNDPVLDRVSITRAVVSLPENLSDREIEKQISKFKIETANINSCSKLRRFHETYGSNVPSKINNVVIEQLENSFKELVLGLKVGEISDVIHTYDNQLVVFMICDRRKMDADIPSLEKLKEAEFNKLYSVLSLRYLMRLRRTASIELKM